MHAVLNPELKYGLQSKQEILPNPLATCLMEEVFLERVQLVEGRRPC